MTTKLLIDRELLERIPLDVLKTYGYAQTAHKIESILAAPRQPEVDGLEVVAYRDGYGTAMRADILRQSQINDMEPLCRLSDAQRAIAELREECERLRVVYLDQHDKRVAMQIERDDALTERDTLRQQLADSDAKRAIAELREEISDLHTTMMAAAVEIQKHWQAHCDEEGYGPASLCIRLERGIASQYGYTAQTFVQIEAERDTLRQQLTERDATITRLEAGIPRIQEQSHQMRQQRDRLAGLLREARHFCQRAPSILPHIDAALAEVGTQTVTTRGTR